MTSRTCPSRQQVVAYARGRLPEAEAAAVADHLESCPHCEAAVRELEDKVNPALVRLRESPAPDPYLDEPDCEQVLGQVKAGGPDPSTSFADTDTMVCADLPEGSRLREYQILEKLGEGGMGAVYRALHSKLKRIVALKVLPARRVTDPRRVARFEREMEAAGKLDHPNIVRATDAGEWGDTHFLVMEYLDGLNLSELARRCGPLRINDACELIRQASLGLQYAHEHVVFGGPSDEEPKIGQSSVLAWQRFLTVPPWKAEAVQQEIQTVFHEQFVPGAQDWPIGTVGLEPGRAGPGRSARPCHSSRCPRRSATAS